MYNEVDYSEGDLSAKGAKVLAKERREKPFADYADLNAGSADVSSALSAKREK
jgi:hypothetical protein